MGQTNIKDNRRFVKGGISIQIPKIQFSNEIIQGVLHINLQENFQGHILILTLEGLEEFHFHLSETGRKHNQEKNKFLNLSIPIYDFAQNHKLNSEQFNMNPGQWSIPFEMKIAQVLPSSMEYFINKYNYCRITYNLVAEIIPNDSNCQPVEGRQEILIGQQLSMENQQEVKSQKIVQPKCCACCCCCCFSSGEIQLSGKINKPSFSPKEKIQISFDCDFSRSSYFVQSVDVELKGELIMMSREYQKEGSKFLKFSKQNVRVDSQKSFSKSIEIEVPESIQLSVHSSLIKLKHFVSVTPVLNGCCCVGVDQTLNFDVKINPTPSQLQFLEIPNNVQPLQSPPSNWNPMILQSQQYNEEEALKIQQLCLAHQQQQQKNKPQQNQNQNQQPQMIYPL